MTGLVLWLLAFSFLSVLTIQHKHTHMHTHTDSTHTKVTRKENKASATPHPRLQHQVSTFAPWIRHFYLAGVEERGHQLVLPSSLPRPNLRLLVCTQHSHFLFQ